MLSLNEFKNLYKDLCLCFKENSRDLIINERNNSEKLTNNEDVSDINNVIKEFENIDVNKIPVDNEELLSSLKEFFIEKFKDSSSIFKNLTNQHFLEFLKKCKKEEFSGNSTIFEKGSDCIEYFFLLFGDIMLYSDKREEKSSKLLKTINGIVFGHKVKDKFQYEAYSQDKVILFSILKTEFDSFIEKVNLDKSEKKIRILKKFIPNLRSVKNKNTLNNFRECIFKYEYIKGNRIISSGGYDEYVYLILDGTCKAIKNLKKMGNMSKDIVDNEEFSNSYIVLETYSKNLLKFKKKGI